MTSERYHDGQEVKERSWHQVFGTWTQHPVTCLMSHKFLSLISIISSFIMQYTPAINIHAHSFAG